MHVIYFELIYLLESIGVVNDETQHITCLTETVALILLFCTQHTDGKSRAWEWVSLYQFCWQVELAPQLPDLILVKISQRFNNFSLIIKTEH